MSQNKLIFLSGSLRNPKIPLIGNKLRAAGFDVYDDWHAAGDRADDEWKRYEQARGRTYVEALGGEAAEHVFEFDLIHLDMAHIGVLVLPAGKSGFLELGYMMGQGKPGYILLDDTVDVRWDVMVKFAYHVSYSMEDLIAAISEDCKRGGDSSEPDKSEASCRNCWCFCHRHYRRV